MTEPLTITDAAPLIRAGTLTPSDLLEQCLRRVDVYEPAVKAWAFLDRERARRDAARLTDEAKAGQYRGPLHGIPVGVKDIIDVFDMPTGCGSKRWANSYARRDATVVERLRQAGAVIVGKTVTTPFAYLDPPPTRNPWDLSRTPGGSSSGSAAAVACGMVLGALGTQTGGSLTRPASYCGVCSLKPTHRRVTVDGVLPLSRNLDHVGVMANCVRDLAFLFEVVAGADSVPDFTESWPVPDCVHAIDHRGYRGFAQVRGLFDQRTEAIGRTAVAAFRKRADGIDCPIGFKDIVPPPSFTHVHRWHRTIMAVEAARVHADRQARVPEDYPPRITELIQGGLRPSAAELSEAYQEQTHVRMQVDHAIRHHPVWITAATTGPAPTADTTGDPTLNAPWSFAGLPTVSLPIARTADGLPIAIQLIAEERAEDRLLAAAANCERVPGFDRRLPPVP